MNGIVVLDKPAGISSAAAVDRVKRALQAQRAGHGGTLDPIATGVLVICLGEATKVASYLLADAKAYIAELTLGIETDTLDRTGAIVAVRDAGQVSRDQVETALRARLGEQQQLPPMFSAIKQGGVRLYKQARNGVEVEREPRRICIDHLELVEFAPAGCDPRHPFPLGDDGQLSPAFAAGDSAVSPCVESAPRAVISVACSKGTYIRSLVADIGRDLGCGAHLSQLRRTRSGAFSIARAHPLEGLDGSCVVAMETALTLPVIAAPDERLSRIRSGLQLETAQVPGTEAIEVGQRFQLRDATGNLVAIAHVQDGRLRYDRVFRACAENAASPG